jgi:hypothetical protein
MQRQATDAKTFAFQFHEKWGRAIPPPNLKLVSSKLPAPAGALLRRVVDMVRGR